MIACRNCANCQTRIPCSQCSSSNSGYFYYYQGKPYCGYRRVELKSQYESCQYSGEVYYCKELRRVCTFSGNYNMSCSKNKTK